MSKHQEPSRLVFLTKLIALVFIFRILLDYGYWRFVYPVFEYSGFTFEFNLYRVFISWVVVIVALLILFCKRKSPLIYIYFVIYTISILPIASYYALSGNNAASFWSSVITFMAISLLLPKTKYVQVNIRENRHSAYNIIVFLITALTLANLGYLIYSTKGHFVLSFSDVYDFRADNIGSYAGIFGYLNSWAMKVFAPFLVAVGIARKNKIIIYIALMLCFMFYAFTGHKSALMPIILCVFLYYVFKKNNQPDYSNRFFVLCLSGLIAFTLLGIVLYFWEGQIVFASLFFRRAFFVPAFLNAVYFEMFQGWYSHVYWSNSILSSFVSYPYGVGDITKVVGAYLNHPDMGANTGFVASGYMQAGYWGIGFYTFIIVLFNQFVVKIAHWTHPIIFNATLLVPYLGLFTSSDLPTSFLTHGILIAAVVLYVYSGILKFRS